MAKVIFKWQQKQFSFSSLIATSAWAQLAGRGKEVIHASYSGAACPAALAEKFWAGGFEDLFAALETVRFGNKIRS